MTSRTGGYWRFAEGRIQKYTRDRLERDLGPYPWRREVLVSCACEDDQGNLVVGTEGAPGDAAFWFSADGRSRQIQGLAHSSVFAVLADREGSLWLGTDGGLNRVKRQMFEALPGTEGSTVQSVCADAKGGLWVGYNSDRIDYWNGDTIGHFSVQSPPVAVAVRSVFVDDRQHVWSGTLAGGLFQFLNGAFVQDGAFAEVGNNWVSCIHQSRDGALWTGTQGGLVRFKDGQWRTFGALDGLSAPKVQVITEDSAGNLWIGTDGGGLNCLRDGKVTVFNKTNGLPSDNISALLADGDGSLWVGTSGGLARHRAGKWSAFTTRDGLAGNSVAYLLDDTRGYMWIGSNGGLMRAAKSALHAYADRSTNTLVIRSYGPPEGVPAREASQGSQPAACRTVDGWLWFATIKGLAGVNPANISINSNPPPVVIESVFVDGRPVGTNTLRSEPPHMLRVPARREALDVHYASLNLGSPEKARVRYRLEDHEAKWTEALGNRGVAHYSKLPPGDYTFHLQAANEDDVWNLQGAQLAVTVLPPFWRTWWFIGLVAVSTIAGIAAVVHYLSTQKLQRQVALLRQQEALERERARIARDLHDQLGANLTQVALLGEMAEADKNLPAEVEDHAKQIAQTARETTRALDEIVWTVNPANDTLDGLLNYICKYAEDYLAMAGLRYRLEVPRELPDILIAPDLRHNVFLVAKEAINNIVKHAHASSVWLRLKLETGQFILEIQDDGRGLPADAGQKGRSGLKNMRARMADVAGKFEVGRAPDGGTMVRLAAPLQPAGIISEHVTQT